MKKKILIISILIIVIAIVGIVCYFTYKNSNTLIELDNIEGKYSNVVITNFDTAKKSLEDVKELLPINSTDELKEDSMYSNDNLVNTYTLNQTYNGIEIYNKGLIVYADKEGNAEGVINKCYQVSNFSITPKHTENELEEKALEELKNEYENLEIKNTKLIIYPLDNNNCVLAYLYEIDIGIGTATVIINDETGEVLEVKIPISELSSNNLEEFKYDDQAKNILKGTDYKINANYAMIDKERKILIGIILGDGSQEMSLYSWNSEEDMNSDEKQLSLTTLNSAQKIYDYFKNKFRYLSFDGSGNENIEIHTGLTKYKEKNASDNAIYCEPNYIFLGKDNIYNDDVEILGHEFMHGIIYNKIGSISESNTEGKAINEAYADIMGMCIEAYYDNNNKIDGYINESKEKSGAKRDIKNSKNKYKENKSEKGLGKEEHENSTIISRAAYNMSKELTIEEFENLWFGSMDFLYKNPNFYDCKYAVLKRAELMNLSKEKQEMIKKAFEDVGIKQGFSIKYTEDAFKDILKEQIDSITENIQDIPRPNQITQEKALEIVTNMIRPTYSTAYIEKIDVDITSENINNESYLNYYVFRTIIGEDFYTLVVNKNTSKIYLFDENNQNNLQEITQDNMTQYIKITKYTGNGYTILIKNNGNCHLSIDTRTGADDGEYADEDGTYIIENSKITVTLSSSKKYEFNITDLNTITIIEQEKASSEFGVGTYKAKETDGQYVIQIKENNKCHFQAQSPFLNINSDGTYTLSNNTITFKLNSGKTISCSIKNNNQIYWSEESMTFFKN